MESRMDFIKKLEESRKIKEAEREQRKQEKEQERQEQLKLEMEERKQDASVGTVGSDVINKDVLLYKGANPNSKHRKDYIAKLNGKHKYTKAAKERANKTYQYLLEVNKSGREMPNLRDMSKEMGIPYSTLRDHYLVLQSQKKLIYKNGKITLLKVAEGTIDRDNIYKEVKTEAKVSKSEFLTRYDNAVKEMISDLIRNSSATNKNEFISYIESITNITDALRNKLV